MARSINCPTDEVNKRNNPEPVTGRLANPEGESISQNRSQNDIYLHADKLQFSIEYHISLHKSPVHYSQCGTSLVCQFENETSALNSYTVKNIRLDNVECAYNIFFKYVTKSKIAKERTCRVYY